MAEFLKIGCVIGLCLGSALAIVLSLMLGGEE